MSKILMTLAAVAFAIATLSPANAAPRHHFGLGSGGIYSPYGGGSGSPQSANGF